MVQVGAAPEGIIKKDGVGIEVGCTSNVDTLPLTTTEVHSSQAAHRLVSLGQHLKVELKRTRMDDLAVVSFIEFLAERDVLPEGQVLDPSGLQDNTPINAPCFTAILQHAHISTSCPGMQTLWRNELRQTAIISQKVHPHDFLNICKLAFHKNHNFCPDVTNNLNRMHAI